MKHKIVKQRTLNIMVFSVMFLIVVFVAVNTFLIRNSIGDEVKAERNKAMCERLSREILEASDNMTDQIRCFVVTNNGVYLDNYWQERFEKKTYDEAVLQLEERKLPPEERELLTDIRRNLNLLMNEEVRAIRLATDAGHVDAPAVVQDFVLNIEDQAMSDEEKAVKARDVLFGGDYTYEKQTVRQKIEKFQSVIEVRLEEELRRAENATDNILDIQRALLVMICSAMVFIFWLVYSCFTRPIVSYSKQLEQFEGKNDQNEDPVLQPEGSAEIQLFAEKFNQVFSKMQEASRVKSEFLASMSHEIRTPLNTLTGYRFLLEQTALNEEQKEYVAAMEKADILLQQHIGNILDYSRLNAEKTKIERIQFDLWEMLDSLETLFGARVQEKNLYLKIEKAENLPRYIKGDLGKLRQVLVNLIGNGVKFTGQGGITVRCEKNTSASFEAEGEEKKYYDLLDEFMEKDDRLFWLAISVTDTGIGIRRENWDKVFCPFEQAEQNTTRRFGGTGLGLSICRKLTGLMGGRIYLMERKKGSRFIVKIPVRTASAPKEGDSKAERVPLPGSSQPGFPQYPGRCILLVEDNYINQKMEQKIFSLFGLEVDTASSGEEAVSKGCLKTYDLIFMDIHMEDMDGFAAAEKIREGGRNLLTPVVALTADVEKENLRRTLLDMDGYLTKPVRSEDLPYVLREFLGWPVRTAAVQEEGKEEMRVLFSRRHEEDVYALARLGEQREAEGLKKKTHMLKGVCAVLEFDRMKEELIKLEELIRINRPHAEWMEQIQAIEIAYENIVQMQTSAKEYTDRVQGQAAWKQHLPQKYTEEDIAAGRKGCEHLRKLLEAGDFEALQAWKETRALLGAVMEESDCQKLQHAVENMDFSGGAEILRHIKKGSGTNVSGTVCG